MQITPFIQTLIQRCGSTQSPKRVVLPEGEDQRTLEAARLLLDLNCLENIHLIGRESVVMPQLALSTRAQVGSKLILLEPSEAKLQKLTSAHCRQVLEDKGKNPSHASISALASDPLFQAGSLLAQGQVDCAVAGACATTAEVIRAALTTVGLAPGIKTVSGGFFMDRSTATQTETYYYADAGVVIEPTISQLVDIASASCEMWKHIIGTAPVVAFLSFSTKGSAKHESAERMALACEEFRKLHPDIDADGELQFDAAFDKAIGLRKAPQSQVPGRANVFIFPNLSAANIAYKITQRLAGFAAYGPNMQGLARPYSDLSRGASASDIVVSTLINCLKS